jgi:hypothetical protein
VLSNLRWDTRKANAEDMVKHGRSCVGENNPRAKLSVDRVRLLKRLHRGGMPPVALARYFARVRGDMTAK